MIKYIIYCSRCSSIDILTTRTFVIHICMVAEMYVLTSGNILGRIVLPSYSTPRPGTWDLHPNGTLFFHLAKRRTGARYGQVKYPGSVRVTPGARGGTVKN